MRLNSTDNKPKIFEYSRNINSEQQNLKEENQPQNTVPDSLSLLEQLNKENRKQSEENKRILNLYSEQVEMNEQKDKDIAALKKELENSQLKVKEKDNIIQALNSKKESPIAGEIYGIIDSKCSKCDVDEQRKLVKEKTAQNEELTDKNNKLKFNAAISALVWSILLSALIIPDTINNTGLFKELWSGGIDTISGIFNVFKAIVLAFPKISACMSRLGKFSYIITAIIYLAVTAAVGIWAYKKLPKLWERIKNFKNNYFDTETRKTKLYKSISAAAAAYLICLSLYSKISSFLPFNTNWLWFIPAMLAVICINWEELKREFNY